MSTASWRAGFVLGVALWGAAGCEEEASRGSSTGPQGPIAPKGGEKIDPLDAAIAEQESYVYNPIGLRDPFRSFLTFGTAQVDNTPRTPLQKYEIDQYKLVGIVWGIDRPRALVEDPEGVGHVLEIGTYIGRNWGKVTQITDNEVVVTEEFKTMEDELVVNPIKLTLVTEDL